MFDEKDQNANNQANKTPDNFAEDNSFLKENLKNTEENRIKEDLPEDIFEDVDKVENFNNKNISSDLNDSSPKTPKKSKSKKVLLFVLVIIIAVAVLLFLLFRNLSQTNKTIHNNPLSENSGLENLIEDEPEIEDEYLLEEEPNPNISNEEEDIIINNNKEVDISVLDSDGDGLTDYQETEIWGTDPYNPDTDGDGYSDFDEIKAGYNPLGDGLLE